MFNIFVKYLKSTKKILKYGNNKNFTSKKSKFFFESKNILTIFVLRNRACMNQSKEVLEILTKVQSKQMELFLEAVRQIVEAWGKENFVEKFTQAYKNWFDEQTKLMREMNELLQKHAGISMPSHLLDLQKMQENFGKNWFDYIRENAGEYADIFKTGSIEQINEVWNKIYEAWFEPFMRPFKEFSASGVGGYNVMMNAVKDYLKAFSGKKQK